MKIVEDLRSTWFHMCQQGEPLLSTWELPIDCLQGLDVSDSDPLEG